MDVEALKGVGQLQRLPQHNLVDQAAAEIVSRRLAVDDDSAAAARPKSRNTDGTWEAEAAMMRILPRLGMIRLTVPRTLLSGGIRWRIASRVVAAAADGGYRGMLSVAPELSLWEKLSVNALADRSAMFATNLERRTVRIRGDRIRHTGRRTFR